MSTEMSPRDEVIAIFEKAITDGLRRESVGGATDAEIDAMAAQQGVDEVPAAAREVLRHVGKNPSLWFAGSSFGVSAVDRSAKDGAIASLSMSTSKPAGSENMLVLVAHGGYSYHAIDGADLAEENPPVWLIDEGEAATQQWDSVTSWFRAMTPDIARYRTRARIFRNRGDGFAPAWANAIRTD